MPLNILELDAHAEGLCKYLTENTERPVDGMAILGLALLKLYDRTSRQDSTFTDFAAGFHKSMLESYNARSSVGPSSKH